LIRKDIYLKFPPMTDYYKQFFIKDLDSLKKKTKVLVSGIVLDIKYKEKLVIFNLDDSTGIIECILFKPADKKVEIQVGYMLTISGDFDIEEYHNEINQKIIVQNYSILEDVNQELLFYLSTFAENSLEGAQQQRETLVEVESMDITPQTEKKIKKRIPLKDESLSLKIRSLLFKFLNDEIQRALNHENIYTSFTDMMTSKLISDLNSREHVDSSQIENAILDLERLNFITPIYDHSMVETSGTRYTIEVESVLKVGEQILEMIKESGSNGVKVSDIYKSLNELYDMNTYMFSQHYIWEVANDLYERNKVFLGKNNFIHYVERL
jgi:hypothetical protein